MATKKLSKNNLANIFIWSSIGLAILVYIFSSVSFLRGYCGLNVTVFNLGFWDVTNSNGEQVTKLNLLGIFSVALFALAACYAAFSLFYYYKNTPASKNKKIISWSLISILSFITVIIILGLIAKPYDQIGQHGLNYSLFFQQNILPTESNPNYISLNTTGIVMECFIMAYGIVPACLGIFMMTQYLDKSKKANIFMWSSIGLAVLSYVILSITFLTMSYSKDCFYVGFWFLTEASTSLSTLAIVSIALFASTVFSSSISLFYYYKNTPASKNKKIISWSLISILIFITIIIASGLGAKAEFSENFSIFFKLDNDKVSLTTIGIVAEALIIAYGVALAAIGGFLIFKKFKK